jgi:hypothetical protein
MFHILNIRTSNLPNFLSVHITTSFMKGLVHSEVLEEIERLVYKGLIHSMQITVRNSIVTVFYLDTMHILLARGIKIRNWYIKLADVNK